MFFEGVVAELSRWLARQMTDRGKNERYLSYSGPSLLPEHLGELFLRLPSIRQVLPKPPLSHLSMTLTVLTFYGPQRMLGSNE